MNPYTDLVAHLRQALRGLRLPRLTRRVRKGIKMAARKTVRQALADPDHGGLLFCPYQMADGVHAWSDIYFVAPVRGVPTRVSVAIATCGYLHECAVDDAASAIALAYHPAGLSMYFEPVPELMRGMRVSRLRWEDPAAHQAYGVMTDELRSALSEAGAVARPASYAKARWRHNRLFLDLGVDWPTLGTVELELIRRAVNEALGAHSAG